MPKEQSPGKPTTRRYSEQEKAAAVRMVLGLKAGLHAIIGDDQVADSTIVTWLLGARQQPIDFRGRVFSISGSLYRTWDVWARLPTRRRCADGLRQGRETFTIREHKRE